MPKYTVRLSWLEAHSGETNIEIPTNDIEEAEEFFKENTEMILYQIRNKDKNVSATFVCDGEIGFDLAREVKE